MSMRVERASLKQVDSGILIFYRYRRVFNILISHRQMGKMQSLVFVRIDMGLLGKIVRGFHSMFS